MSLCTVSKLTSMEHFNEPIHLGEIWIIWEERLFHRRRVNREFREECRNCLLRGDNVCGHMRVANVEHRPVYEVNVNMDVIHRHDADTWCHECDQMLFELVEIVGEIHYIERHLDSLMMDYNRRNMGVKDMA